MEIFLTGLRRAFVNLSCALCVLSVASHFTTTCPAQDQQQVNSRKDAFQKASNSDHRTQPKDDSRAKPMRPVFSGLENPEANELLDQLQSQEIAAAAEVEAIHQLEHEGESKPGEPTIEQRKAKLVRHLDSAFDFKLKLEDLQIKQLQSRLSQLERQTTERKSLRDKIVKRRAAELLDGDVLQWQPWSTTFEAAKRTSGVRPSYEEVDQTIESVREKLRPFIEQVTACQERVRELEPSYFHDHSNAAELQAALDALTEARRTFRREMEPFQVVFDQALKKLEGARVAAEKIRDAMMAQSEKKAQLVADGQATESELRDAIAASEQAVEAADLVHQKLGKLFSDNASYVQYGAYNELQPTTAVKSPSKTSTGYIDEFTIQYWFEKVLKLKVEFVQFDGLNLPFKAAVRVREVCGEYPTYFPRQDARTAGYREGDLIVSLAGNKFETLNQLASALYSFRFDKDNREQWWVNEALRGGLAGTVVSITESCQRFQNGDWNKLCGGTPQQKIWGFEVVTRTKQTVPTETIFAIGTCVSPDGLVAVSVPVNQLVDLEELIVTSPPDYFGNHKAETVRIIAVHKTCGLVLVKVEEDDRVFPWMMCRSTVATVGRPLHLFEWRNGKGVSTGQRVTVISPDETGLTVAESGDRDEDRFFILYKADQANSKSSTSLMPGSALTTIDDRELEGIVLSEDDGSSMTLIPESKEMRTCLAANVVDRLVKKYRAQQQLAQTTLSQSSPAGGELRDGPDDTTSRITALYKKTIQPPIKKVAACQDRIRALEADYFRDHSNAKDMQAAWNKLRNARFEFEQNCLPFENFLKQIQTRLEREVSVAEEFAAAMKVQREKKSELFEQGQISPDKLKALISDSAQADEAVTDAEKKLEEFRDLTFNLLPKDARMWSVDEKFALPSPSKADFDDLTVLTWLERSLGVRLEFVKFEGLDFPFKAALRVRESTSGNYNIGDLIVMVGRHNSKFESVNQIGLELCRFYKDSPQNTHQITVLSGGIAGALVAIDESGWKWTEAREHLLGTSPDDSIWHFEIKTRSATDTDVKTEYVSGVCVGLDGLVAIPIPVDKLVERENIPINAPHGGIARVVANDPKMGLTLLKISLSTMTDRNVDPQVGQRGLSGHGLFHWVACRSTPASPGQVLKLFDWPPRSRSLSDSPTTVATSKEVGLESKPVEDRFNVRPTTLTVSLGSPLVSDDNALQGLALTRNPRSTNFLDCVEASAIDRLIKDYRKSQLNVAAVDTDLQHKPDNRVAEVPRPKRQSAIVLSPEVIKSKRELIPKFLLAGSMVSQQSYVTGIARAVDLVSKDRDLLEVVILELKAGMDTDPPRTSVRRLLDVLPKACFSYGLRRWKHEQELPSQIVKPAGAIPDDANTQAKALDEADSRVLAEIIALGYRADRNTIEHFTCAIRNLHHVDGQGFLRDVLREEPNGQGNPFEDKPAFNPSPRDNGVTKKAGSLWEDNIGGGWEEATFVAAVGLAELGDSEGVLWLLSRAKPNPFGIDGNLSYYPHSRSKTESRRESCQQSLVDLFDLKPNATVEELQTWWEKNRTVFRPRAAQIGTRKIP